MATRLQRLRRGGPRESFPFAGPAFRRAAPWLLATVALAGLATRIHPALRYAVWGSDSGEYIFLTRQLVETGRILFAYDGWGLAYPYFPGMFVLSGAVHEVIGLDLLLAVQWTTPVVAATIPVLVGLLAYRVTSDPRVGVLAGAFVAVTAPVVLVTSHAMPGTLGHVLLLLLLVLLPDAGRDRRSFILLAIASLALLVTHHLTTYFATGIVAFIAFYREGTQRRTDWRRLTVETPLVLLLAGSAAVWWLGIATPFREEIVGDALPTSPWLTALLFLSALAALPALVITNRRQTKWHKRPQYPSFPRQALLVGGTALTFVGVVLFLTLVRIPGTNIQTDWATLVYVLPVVAFLMFVPLGAKTIRFHRHGTLVLGWLYAILLSLAFASITNSRVLFPFRHVDYMVEAMAPLAALGIVLVYDQTLASRRPTERAAVRTWLVGGLTAVLLVAAVMSLPPREAIGGFEEGLTRAELRAVEWVRDNPAALPPGTAIAADHRLSSVLWGLAGLHATWDHTPRTYHAEDVDEVFAELRSLDIPAGEDRRVDHVILSEPIIEGVTLVQWENSDPMSDAAVRKFDDPRFHRVYDRDGVRIYRIDWDLVDQFESAGR